MTGERNLSDPAPYEGPAQEELQENMPKIYELGEISSIGTNYDALTREIVWEGAIGPKNREQQEPGVVGKTAEILSNLELIESYYVPCTPGAPTQCIDGRRRESYKIGVENVDKHGAKVPGGTPAAAIAYRLVENPQGLEGATIAHDLGNMVQKYRDKGLSLGAHIDEFAKEGFTGCGAIDKMPIILRKITQFESHAQLRFLVSQLLGKSYEPDVFSLMVGRLVELQGKKDDYLLREPGGDYAYRENVVSLIREEASHNEPVEKLIGKHNEIGLAINLVPETTFDRDKFSADNNDLMQLFDFDFWGSFEFAETLYPTHDNISDDARIENARKQREYITFRAMYAVATAMVLTDGSVRLLVRK